MHKRGFIDLFDGHNKVVQVLGDATGIWKLLKVNGTVIVLKVIYPTQKLEGQGMNRINNQKAFAFYLGDDCRDDLERRLPNLASDLADICFIGVEVDLNDDGDDLISGNIVKVKVAFRVGGDFKFLTGLMGINTNAGSYPCALCEVADFKASKQLHLTRAELQEVGVRHRTVEQTCYRIITAAMALPLHARPMASSWSHLGDLQLATGSGNLMLHGQNVACKLMTWLPKYYRCRRMRGAFVRSDISAPGRANLFFFGLFPSIIG